MNRNRRPRAEMMSLPHMAPMTAVLTTGLGLCLVALVLNGKIAVSRLLSSRAESGGSLHLADRAIALTPADPTARDVRAALLSARGEFSEAAREIERALLHRPTDYSLWLKLARAQAQAGDLEKALGAHKQAVRYAPFYAAPRWELGLALLRAGRPDEAFPEMSRAARKDPTLLDKLMSLAWDVYRGDAGRVIDVVEPQTVAACFSLTRFLARHEKPSEAIAVYRSAPTAGAEEMRQELLTQLLEVHQYRVAHAVWASFPQHADDGVTGLTNGDFEQEIAWDEPGFGWRGATDVEGVSLRPDRSSPRTGNTSLRSDFTGLMAGSAPPLLTQLVFIEPATRYRLIFASRTKELVTGGQMVLAVKEAGRSGRELAFPSPLPAGTTAWQEQTLEFKTGEGLEAVLITVRTERCRENICPIFGTLWLDDFRLEKV